MRTFSKIKSMIAIFLVITTMFLMAYIFNPVENIFVAIIAWLVTLITIYLLRYRIYRFDISKDELVYYRLLGHKNTIFLRDLTKIEFEGVAFRSRWLVISLFVGDDRIFFTDISTFQNVDFIKQIIKYASYHGYKLMFDETSQKLIEDMGK